MKNRISLKNIIQFIQGCFTDAHIAFISVSAGISTGVLIYLGLLQRHFFSWRYLANSLVIIYFSTIIYAWLNKNYIIPIYKNFSNNFRVFTLVFSILLAGVLLLNTEIQPLYYILPDKTLEIEFTIDELPSSEEGVRLLWIETRQGYIHYTRMDYKGEWERVFGNTIFPPGQTVRLFWQGKVGPLSDITFRSTNFNQEIRISWDGQESVHQLNNPESPNVTIKQSFKIPLVYTLPFIISFIISITYGVFVFLLALSNWNPGGKKKKVRRSKLYWLLFMLPMLAVWGFALLVFWPGIISNDSIFQWQQGVTGQFDDWQSAFHALILAGLMRIWYSPAVVTLIQIFVFALVVAWGLKTLADYGVPDVFLWLISFLFAIFPPNWILSITIWKDIPYAIAFLWLTILLVKIVLSKGKWLQKPLSWIALSLSVFLVGILRKNGIASAFISLIGLIFFYRKYWKKLLIAVLAVAILFFLISGPLYDFLEVSRTDNGQSNLIYLHHIAAHVNAGTDLTDAESEYLNHLMPTTDWFYWCCYVGTISYDNDFARSEYLSNTVLNRQIAIDLFFRAPWVDIAHSACAGEMSWKFANNQCYMKSTHGFHNWVPGQEGWVVGNEVGLDGRSFFPDLVGDYVLLLRRFGFLDDDLLFYLRPAFWLYIALFSLAVITLRRREFSLWAAAMPIATQTLVLLLVSFAPAYRYHYGTCLSGIFLLALLFLPNLKTQN